MQRFSGRRLKAARIVAGLSRDETAERADISPDTLGGYERGRPPNGSILARLADVLGVRVGDLFVDEEAA